MPKAIFLPSSATVHAYVGKKQIVFQNLSNCAEDFIESFKPSVVISFHETKIHTMHSIHKNLNKMISFGDIYASNLINIEVLCMAENLIFKLLICNRTMLFHDFVAVLSLA